MVVTKQYLMLPAKKYYRAVPVMLVLLLCTFLSHAQLSPAVPLSPDKGQENPADTLQVDSLGNTDSAAADSIKVKNKETQLGIKISKNGLDSKITATTRDSMIIDVPAKVYHMYGDVQIHYSDIGLKGGVVQYDQASHTITSSPQYDTTGKKLSVQEFSEGSQTSTYDSMKYNFESKRAIVRNAKSQYGEGFVISQQVKHNADGSIYGWKNGYTTCDLDTPHFAIRARRIKVVPGKIIASGPANLEIENIPTPLFVPFGIFPIGQSNHSGFMLPSYTLEEQRGLGLQRGGYYFSINDHLGVVTQFDIFSKGSWAFLGTANYANRYHYNGSIQIGYNFTKRGEVYEPDGSISRDFSIAIHHQQDAKANPGSSFSADVNIVSSKNYNLLNGIDAMQMLNNNFSSSISYAKTWTGRPYSFTAALRHNQNTQTGQVDVTLPDVSFAVSQFTPFQRKIASGTPRWYEKISASYNIRMVNEWSFFDSTFNINKINLSDFNNGIVQNASISASYNLLRFFNLSLSVPYTEYWNTKQVFTDYNSTTDRIDTTFNTGFFASRSFSFVSSVSTRLYGVKMFRKGKVAGIRHVLTPQVGFTYQPGFANAPFYYLYKHVLAQYSPADYTSPYIGPYSPVGGPSPALPNGAITFGIQNNVQMKVRTNDSAGTKNISLLDAFSINSSYNMFADSCKLQPIIMSMQTSILNVLKLSGGARFDTYRWYNNTRTSQLLANSGGGLIDFRSGNLSLGFDYRAEKKNQEQQEDSAKSNDETHRLLNNGGIDDYYDFSIPWNINVSYSFNANKYFNKYLDRDTLALTQSMMVTGSLNLTPRMQVNVQSGYNFTTKEIGLTSINISRDLHCWMMSLNLVPFGPYRSFNFLLQVKASVLQDLKLIRRKTYLDNF